MGGGEGQKSTRTVFTDAGRWQPRHVKSVMRAAKAGGRAARQARCSAQDATESTRIGRADPPAELGSWPAKLSSNVQTILCHRTQGGDRHHVRLLMGASEVTNFVESGLTPRKTAGSVRFSGQGASRGSKGTLRLALLAHGRKPLAGVVAENPSSSMARDDSKDRRGGRTVV